MALLLFFARKGLHAGQRRAVLFMQDNIMRVVHALWDGAVCAEKQSSERIVREEQWVRMIWIVWR